MPPEPPAPARTPAPEPVPEYVRTDAEIRAELEESLKHVAFVDVSHLAESKARDVGESKMNLNKSEMKGIKGFFTKIWRSATEGYRKHKAIAEAKAAIYDTQNLGADKGADKTAHDEAMAAVTERFVSEYISRDDLKKNGSGEDKKTLDENDAETKKLKGNIQKLIREYATGALNDDDFNTERRRLLAHVNGLGNYENVVGEGKMYADNLMTIAQQVKQAVAHGVALETIDLNFDLTIGKATSGVRTESHLDWKDRTIERLTKSIPGNALINETVIAGGVNIAAFLMQRATRTFARGAGFFGGGVFVGSALAGAKAATRAKTDRAQHLRDVAMGRVPMEDKAPRREKYNETAYESKGAEELTAGLMEFYVDGNPKKGLKPFASQAEFDAAVAHLSEIEARITLSKREQIDLISYSEEKSVEAERTRLEISQAQAKALFKKACADDPAMKAYLAATGSATFDKQLEEAAGAFQHSTLEKDMEAKDKVFRSLKRGEIGKAMLKGALAGTIIGTVFQEAHAFFDDKTDGFIEHLTTGSKVGATHSTVLGQIFEGKSGSLNAFRELHSPNNDIPGLNGNMNEHFRFPEGVTATQNSDGTINLMYDGRGIPVPKELLQGGGIMRPDGKIALGDHIPFKFNPDGSPTPETLVALTKAHISPEAFTHNLIQTPVETEVGPKDYMQNYSHNAHDIVRDRWNSNGTEEFDQDELRTHWGGRMTINEHGKLTATGIDDQGRYILNINTMTSDGSFHTDADGNEDYRTDPQAADEAGNMKCLISLSKDSQNKVFEVPLDGHGNIIMDPTTPEGKEMLEIGLFSTDATGHAHFMGQYLEVAEKMPPTADGKEHFTILSTLTGPGAHHIPGTIVGADGQAVHDFALEVGTDGHTDRDVDMMPFIPVGFRTPLERMKDRARQVRERAGTPTPVPAPAPNPEGPLEDEPLPIPINEGGEPIPKGGFRGETMTRLEYAAIQDDLKLINKRIQEGKGIITINNKRLDEDKAAGRKTMIEKGSLMVEEEPDLKSELGKALYAKLIKIEEGTPSTRDKNLKGDGFNNNPESISEENISVPGLMKSVYQFTPAKHERVVFNRDELREIGDELEKALSEAKVIEDEKKKTLDDDDENENKEKISNEEKAAIAEDIKFIEKAALDAGKEDEVQFSRADFNSTESIDVLKAILKKERNMTFPVSRSKNKATFTKAEVKAAIAKLNGIIAPEVPKKEPEAKKDDKNTEPKKEPVKNIKELEKEGDVNLAANYEKFKNDGDVSFPALALIAGKLFRKEALTEKEKEINEDPEQGERIKAMLDSKPVDGANTAPKNKNEGKMEGSISSEAFLKGVLPDFVRKAFAKFDLVKIPRGAFKGLKLEGDTIVGEIKVLVKGASGKFVEGTLKDVKIANGPDNWIKLMPGINFVGPKNEENTETKKHLIEAVQGINKSMHEMLGRENGAKTIELASGRYRTTFDKQIGS